jgi:hypothetical protein
MATRSCIKIEGVTFAKVYKHWDGYPNAMLGWLETFNKSFAENRGDDPQYKFAQLLRSSTNPIFELDKNEFTGYGVVPFEANCGEEFEYTLMPNGEVVVKEI